MIADAEILIGGTALDPSLQAKLVEVRVDENLRLPDTAVVRLADPGLELVDAAPFEIGKDLEVKFAPTDTRTLTTLFKGQIASLEPEFTRQGVVLAARAYDGAHKLNVAGHTHTYQNMTPDDIAKKIAQRAGLKAGKIDAAGSPSDFVQQSNETDWDFLWRLAGRIDFEVRVRDGQLHFRQADRSFERPVHTIRWGEQLLSFRPRVTAAQQPAEVVVRAWDPMTKQKIEASSSVERTGSKAGVERESVVESSAGRVVVSDRPLANSSEAQALAESVAARLGNAYLQAEGVCRGDPRLRAGAKIAIEGVGKRFNGEYAISSTRHVIRGTQGYETQFSVAGRNAPSLAGLMSPAAPRPWTNGVVIGTVTQNDDPQKLGRVRVTYPALDDSAEGWWARIAAPGAGAERGLLMTPVVGDEVLVAFEHGDSQRPYVIGALWNGRDMPGDLPHPDGSFALKSDRAVSVVAREDITIKSDKDLVVEIEGKASTKARDGASLESTQQVTIKAGTSLKLEGTTELTISCGAASISLNAAGMVKVSGTQIQLG